MHGHMFTLIIALACVVTNVFPVAASPLMSDPIHVPVEKWMSSGEMDDETMRLMDDQAQQNEELLRITGNLINQEQASIKLSWPLKSGDGDDYGHTYFGNYYDHDTSGGLQDYNCGEITYNGHQGTDFFLYPFPWMLLESEDMTVVAAAPGQIVFKQDGYNDTCTLDANWNAVKVLHSDGTAMWYGHMKKGSVTTKAVGQYVATGEALGKVGSSGKSGSPHLHMQLNISNNTSSAYDPFNGPCSSAASRWVSQPAYYDPAVLALTSHSAAVESTQCDDVPHFSDLFSRGDTVYLYSWYRTGDGALPMSYSVTMPDGSEYTTWSQDSATYWVVASDYTFFTLPNDAMEGPWTYSVTYAGETTSHTFCVESCTYTEPTTANVVPALDLLIGETIPQ